MGLYQRVRGNRGGGGSVRLLLSWHERAASASPPLGLLTVSHIRLIALDGAFEAGAAVVDVVLRRRYVGVS